jgi:hypothetical protein
VYSGETQDCLPYFKSLGYEAPPFVNPAEFLIDLVAIDNRTHENEHAGLQGQLDPSQCKLGETDLICRMIPNLASMLGDAKF